MPEIENHLGTLRQKRGISAAQLARSVGVTRQTIYAMEAGSYVPNTAVALRLAQALEVKVEDLFALPQAEPAGLRSEEVTLLPGSDSQQPGQPVQLCRVNKRLVASPPSPFPWYFPMRPAIPNRILRYSSKRPGRCNLLPTRWRMLAIWSTLTLSAPSAPATGRSGSLESHRWTRTSERLPTG